MTGRWEELRTREMLADVCEYTFEILYHLPVFEPYDTQVARSKKPVSRFIVARRLFTIVRGAIKLHDQFLDCTVKVDDVRPNTIADDEICGCPVWIPVEHSTE